MKRDVESPQDVPLDAPLRLETAAGLAYPDGSMAHNAIAKAAANARDHFSLD